MIPTHGLKTIREALKGVKWVYKRQNKQTIYYLNCPCSFDIETSSLTVNGDKFATMYLWGLDINGAILHGRTWEEYTEVIDEIVKIAGLDETHKMIIYVHNLAYEFQFLRPYFSWTHIFAREVRKPITAESDNNIIYKCSYFLSGYKLSILAKNLTKHSIEKLDELYDYDLIRHSGTPLTPQEIQYNDNDLKIVEYYIAEEIERNGNIAKIPLTQTGYVRRFLKGLCLPARNQKFRAAYRAFIKTLTVTDNEYIMWKQAYTGGFTHANIHHSFQVCKNCRSQDFTSSYPAVLLAEQYPISSGTPRIVKDKKTFNYYINHYCCIFQVAFRNLQVKGCIETPLSYSKCRGVIRPTIDNGRIMSADYLETTITEVDLEILQSFYTYSEMLVGPMYTYEKGYLPKPILEGILQLYEKKTQLKGIEGKEAEYLHSKEMLNACYGAAVTDIVSPVITYDNDEWDEEPADTASELKKYNSSNNRFLYYPWGLYCTAYARRNLFSGIHQVGTNYIYSDTDSIKYFDAPETKQYFRDYNDYVHYKNLKSAAYLGTDPERYRPEDIHGNKHEIGLWDDEGAISRFKTLGAKRYLAETEKGLSLTVAGVRKAKDGGEFNGLDYLKELDGDPFDNFDDDLVIPAGYSGKKILSYCDYPQTHMVTDYLGNKRKCREKMFVHMEEGTYSMDIADEYLEVFRVLVEKEL